MYKFEIEFGNTFSSLRRLSETVDKISDLFGQAAKQAVGFVSSIEKPIDLESFSLLNIGMDAFLDNMERAADGLMSFMEPGIRFEQKMAELSAGTGVTGAALEKMGQQARELAVSLGVPADTIADVYLSNLSKLSPELARTAEGQQALADMARTTALLAKGMGNNLEGATEALTTMMNAYNIDMSQPAEAAKAMATMADMLTVSFKEGAVDVAPLAESMRVLGAVGYQANVSLSETLATLQVLGQKAGKTGAEAGVAFRNILATLAQGELMPKQTLDLLKQAGVDISTLTDKTLPLAERLRALRTIAGEDALLAELFGKENLVAGQALLQNIDLLEEFALKTQNAQGAAGEYAATVMNTTQGALERMKAVFNEIAISAFESLKPYVPMLSFSAQMAMGLSALLPMLSGMGVLLRTGAVAMMRYVVGLRLSNGALMIHNRSLLGVLLNMSRWAGSMIVKAVVGLGAYIASLTGATGATWIFNAALYANPIGLIILGIMALGGALWWLMERFGGFGNMMRALWNFIKEYNAFSMLAKAIDYLFGTSLMKTLRGFFDWVEQKIMWLWETAKSLGKAVGLIGDELTMETPPAPKQATKEREITDIFGGGGKPAPAFQAPKAFSATPGRVNKGLQGVAGGGSKPTHITINLQKLQDKIEIHTATLQESVPDIEKQMIEVLLRVLNATNQYQAG